jgi:hypothetical protein
MRMGVLKIFTSTSDAITVKSLLFYFRNLHLLLLSVGPAESRLMHCSLPRLIVQNPLLVPPFISRGAPRQTELETSISERRNYGREMADQIYPNKCDFHVIVGFFNMPQSLRHGTDGFTFPPKEGMLRIFSPE